MSPHHRQADPLKVAALAAILFFVVSVVIPAAAALIPGAAGQIRTIR